MPNTGNAFMLSDKAYNFFKQLVQVILPAFAALYFGLASIWGLPAAEEVVGTTAVIATFLGVSLGISSKQYESSDAAYDGTMNVLNPGEGPKVFQLEVDHDPEELINKKAIRFRVNTDTEEFDLDNEEL